jgi:hypothetical protein
MKNLGLKNIFGLDGHFELPGGAFQPETKFRGKPPKQEAHCTKEFHPILHPSVHTMPWISKRPHDRHDLQNRTQADIKQWKPVQIMSNMQNMVNMQYIASMQNMVNKHNDTCTL